MDCQLCNEPVEDNNRAEGSLVAHRTCLLRCVLGGIGHLQDHNYWCSQRHDPDGGMTYYESGLACDEWVHNLARKGS